MNTATIVLNGKYTRVGDMLDFYTGEVGLVTNIWTYGSKTRLTVAFSGTRYYGYWIDELEAILTFTPGDTLVVPAEFRMNIPAYRDPNFCTVCHVHNAFVCGHFGDGRDTYGPCEYMPWMERAPFNFEWYSTWVTQNYANIRFVREHPRRTSYVYAPYPDGSLGTIPFLRNRAEQQIQKRKNNG